MANTVTEPFTFNPVEGWKWLRVFLGFDRDPLKWTLAGEGCGTIEYLKRLDHLRSPYPFEGEVLDGPNPCFLVKTYAGQRELLWVDTEAREINPLAFLLTYNGQKEYYPDVEIGTPKR